LGTSNTRAIVFNEKGEKLASHLESVRTLSEGELIEQNPHDLWEKTTKAVKAVTSASSIRDDIVVMSITAPGSSVVCLNEAGTPLRNVITHLDTRCKQEVGIVEDNPDYLKISGEIIGGVTPRSTVPRLMWIKENEPDVYKNMHKFLSLTGYLIYRMTGEVISDEHAAVRAFADPYTGKPPHSLLDSLGLDSNMYPEFIKPGTLLPPITEGVASGLGIPKDNRLVMSTYDNLCAFVGAGAVNVGDAVDNSGTIGSFKVVTDKMIVHPEHAVYSIPYPGTPDKWIVGGSTYLAGPVIEWFRKNLRANCPIDELDSPISRSPPGAKGVVFLPYLKGGREPINDPEAMGVFFGLTLEHGVADLTMAVFEGIGYSMLDIMQVLQKMGVPINDVRVSGGLAENSTLTGIKSSMYGRRVLEVHEKESTSLGAAMFAAVGAGMYGNLQEAAENMIKMDNVVEPNQSEHAAYMHGFGTFKRVYEQLKPLWSVSAVDRELRTDTLDHLEEKARQGKQGGKKLTQ